MLKNARDVVYHRLRRPFFQLSDQHNVSVLDNDMDLVNLACSLRNQDPSVGGFVQYLCENNSAKFCEMWGECHIIGERDIEKATDISGVLQINRSVVITACPGAQADAG